MRRCNHCQFENVDDATACARCGQAVRLPAGTAADETASPAQPGWMQSMHMGAGPEGAPSSSNAVAAAATLPVQVRRSRVPVLSVAGHKTAASAPDLPGTAAGSAAGRLSDDAAPTLRSKRLWLLIALVVVIVVLIALALRHGV